MNKLVLVVALALLGCVSAKVLYTRSTLPKGWFQTERAGADERVVFMVALKQQNLEKLESAFWSVSDPKSSNYRNFMTIDEINAIVAPRSQDKAAALAWLSAAGVQSSEITDLSDALEVRTTVAATEKALNTQMYFFVHAVSGKVVIRQFGDYSVPSALDNIVDLVLGVSHFAPPRQKVTKVNAQDGQTAYVPQTVNTLYKIPAGTTGTGSQGVIEFEDQYYSPTDLTNFASDTGMKIVFPTAATIVGTNDPTQPGVESMLDIEYIAAIGQGITNWFWIEADNVWLYGFATHFYSTPNVPAVISVSYGWSESDQCEDGIGASECQQLGVDSQGYVMRVNTEFAKIGARGVSIIVASGDSGVYGRTDPGCSNPHFNPDFPTGSPYVTSVGATQLNNPVFNLNNAPAVCNGQGYQCASGGTEVSVSYAVAGFASGGGFSNYVATPSYQMSAVQGYFKSGVILPTASYYNASGRGYPDVSALGTAIIIDQGGVQTVGGTSASSPIWGGVIGLLNSFSVSAKGKPLGFLNPLLYQAAVAHPSAFHDITSGDNKCTEDGCASSCQGFLATKGWDPVSGLGSPIYSELLAYINSL